jgi:exodeoxyribonuclease VII large subunit
LFSPERKRALPALPRRIALVTAPGGAALQDMLNILGRRCPLVEVLISPCLVQGERAPDSIVEALYRAYEAGVDLVILARGGGSIEDLWAFNDEAVARAVFASPVPVISGVGHETDTTIVDYVADLRAPTPSAAAELAVPELAALRELVAETRARLTFALVDGLAERRAELAQATRAVERHAPSRRLGRDRQQVDDLARRIERAISTGAELRRVSLGGLAGRLEALSPLATLARGYAVARRADTGRVVTSPEHAPPGAQLQITLRDGELAAIVQTPAPGAPAEKRGK